MITARTMIPTEFLSKHCVLRQKLMKNTLFSVLSGDERVMRSDNGADTRKQNVMINNLNSEIEQQKEKINELHKNISDMKMYNDRQDELINALCEKAGFQKI